MAWIGALITVAASAASQESANRGAKKASRSEGALRDREIKIAERQDARGEQLFQEYQSTYLPREREFVANAFSDEASPEAAAARATTDVRSIQAQGRQSDLRQARALGINPTSGAYAALDNQRSLSDAALEVSAKDAAKRSAKDTNFQRQYTSLSLGRNLPSTAGALTSNAQSTLSGLTSLAANRTDQANALAAKSGENLGRSVSNLGLAAWDAYKGRSTGTGAQQTTMMDTPQMWNGNQGTKSLYEDSGLSRAA